MSADRQPPYGVQIIHNFLSDEQCDNWVARAEKKNRSWLEVVDTENSTSDKIVLKPDPVRVTEKVELEEMQEEMNAAMSHAVLAEVEPFIKQKIAWLENSPLLRYTNGGKYLRHADADYFDKEQKAFYKCMDRDFSMLLYLNEEFTGGSINFTRFNYRYRPRKGALLFFPSDHRYLHQAETVTSGVRYAIVSWAALENVPRVMSKPPDGFILPKRTEPGRTVR
jgi:predicted 2-oxoglutarate/Fe(II)-dependent dioxygenase YbiX